MTDDFDIFDELLGTDEPVTAEQEFLARILNGQATKLDQMCVWLGHQVSVYLYLLEDENFHYTRNVATKEGLITKPVSRTDFGRKLVKYYLMLYHLPNFQRLKGQNEVSICDLDIVVSCLLDQKKIKETINRDY